MTVKELTQLIHAAGPDREVVIECEGKQFSVVVASLPYSGPVVLKGI
jgi:acid stress-induced BolA-like protein IbaG/YrbA